MGEFFGAFIFGVTSSDISEEPGTIDSALVSCWGGSAAIPVLQIIGVQSLVNQHLPPLASRAGKAVWCGTLCWVSDDRESWPAG